MLEKIINNFRLLEEKETPEVVIEKITRSIIFRGTNLWILVFAIFIASLGLNINSTAVIIGAMLISPLMGPIMGLGLGFGINDLHLVRKSVWNYTFAVIVGLITSFIYFSVTPLQDAYSELLARTFPTIYDVLIAMFGGLAGILAYSSKQKGNVIPGVAIATALMPPLCTAGFGLATMNLNYFFGAFYLLTINTVFIALSTFLTVKLLGFPLIHLKDSKADIRSRRIVAAVTILTLIPSIYFGYVMVQQNKFSRNANLFIETHSSIDGNYLLNKKVDPQEKQITLIFGGKDISPTQITDMQMQLNAYGLNDAVLDIKQGISFLKNERETDRAMQLNKVLEDKDKKITSLSKVLDSISIQQAYAKQLYRELKIIYPEIVSASVGPLIEHSDSTGNRTTLFLIKTKSDISNVNRKKIENLLKERTHRTDINIIFIK